MPVPYIGEIRIFAGSFAPLGWAFCNGAELPIAQNTALFAVIGTTYGGNGTSTFALPDLRGRAPMGYAPGVPSRRLGRQTGSEAVALTPDQLPPHTHALRARTANGVAAKPNDNVYADGGSYAPNSNGRLMQARTINPAGGGQAHPNMQPFLVMNFIIALEGVFPPRSV